MSGRNTAPSGFLQSTKQILRPNITLLRGFSNHSDSSCAFAGQTGGAIRLSLIFLFLFPSREKEKRCIVKSFSVLLA